MSPAERATLLAMKAQIDAMLGGTEEPAAPPPPAEPKRMRVSTFARARGYAARTITDWCNAGMPHVGKGAARRVLVAEADRWIADDGPARAAEAARLAGRQAAARAAMQ